MRWPQGKPQKCVGRGCQIRHRVINARLVRAPIGGVGEGTTETLLMT